MERFGFYAPDLNISPYHCAKYCIEAAKILSNSYFKSADSWNLSKANYLVWQLGNGKFKKNLKYLVENSSVVLFHNPSSSYNSRGRIGTHTALFLGKLENELVFANQYKDKIEIVLLSELEKRGLEPVQIINPKFINKDYL